MDHQFQQLADRAPVLIWRAGPDGACDYVNRTWLEFTGRAIEQELGSGWIERIHADDRDRCLAAFRQAVDGGQRCKAEYRLLRHDGAWRWIDGTAAPLDGPGGGCTGLMGYGVDIHDGRSDRERLAQTLHDKELLLAELQHRVRNTVQMMVSLLSMQASHAASAEAGDLLMRSAERVRTMGQVQDRLFHRSEPGEIDLADYLGGLVLDRVHAAARPELQVVIQIERLLVPTGLAATLGFIVSELVGNALQHAFPDGAAGCLRLVMVRHSAGEIELDVADNGVGLTAHGWPPPRPAGNRIGLTLLDALARQARARIGVETDGGTRFRLRFRLG